MKKLLFLLSLSIIHCQLSIAQNVGIGTTEPTNKLQVAGNILVNQALTSTNTPPTAGQTKTMVNGSPQTFTDTDSTGRIYDPGGPANNYNDNLNAIVNIFGSSDGVGIAITIEDIDLEAGDSLIIKAQSGNAVLLAFGKNNQAAGAFTFNVSDVAVIFKSNTDGLTGRGFSLLYKTLFPSEEQPAINGFAGNAFYYDASKSALRAGTTAPNDKPGSFSAAIGAYNVASGPYSTAMGNANTATGSFAMATGDFSVANGQNAIAMGHSALANGANSIALGQSTVASGINSIAIGLKDSASGSFAIAMGKETKATGYASFATGDSSQATGKFSTAMGDRNKATGLGSFSIGGTNIASGELSTVMGVNSESTGFGSVAIGDNCEASGDYSTAMGINVSTNGKYGCFIIGDYNGFSGAVMSNTLNDQMKMRFSSGYILYSNDATTTGVTLAAGGGSWSSVSDKRKKENFRTINSEELLQKVASLPITNWNYKSQPASQRHIGPMAQDFYAAFHLDGEGADTTINTMDISGVNMAAIQALNAKCKMQNEKTEVLEKQVALLQKENEEMKKQLQEVLHSLQPKTAQK